MLNRLQAVCRSFQRHGVKCVVIGGVASILHGVPRATFDLEVLIEAPREKAQWSLDALIEAGLATVALTSADAVLANMRSPSSRTECADVQTSMPGLDLSEAWSRRKTVTYQSQDFFIRSKGDLIKSKHAAGRPVDLEDVRLLELPDVDKAEPEGALET